MKSMNNIRTDMAYELRQRHDGEISGVRCEAENICGLDVFCVDIFNSEGEHVIGKPRGRYYTLNLPHWFDR